MVICMRMSRHIIKSATIHYDSIISIHLFLSCAENLHNMAKCQFDECHLALEICISIDSFAIAIKE